MHAKKVEARVIYPRYQEKGLQAYVQVWIAGDAIDRITFAVLREIRERLEEKERQGVSVSPRRNRSTGRYCIYIRMQVLRQSGLEAAACRVEGVLRDMGFHTERQQQEEAA